MTGGNDSGAPPSEHQEETPSTAPNHSATTSAAPQPDTDKRMTIYVKDQSGTQIEFRIKSTTKFEKVFMAFEKAQGRQGLRFHFDGERVNADQTPGDVSVFFFLYKGAGRLTGDRSRWRMVTSWRRSRSSWGVGWKDERRCRAMD